MTGTFVHLDVKSAYNYNFNSLVRVKELIEQTKANGMNAVALTDECVMHAVVDFYLLAKEYQVKPIIGLSMDIVDEKFPLPVKITLLAKNYDGYCNLVKMSSLGQLRQTANIYLTLQELETYQQDTIMLIDMSAYFEKEKEQEATPVVQQFVSRCKKEDVYVTMKQHGFAQQARINAAIEKMATSCGIEYVAVNDVHYLEKSHADVQAILVQIQERKEVFTNQKYFKTETEMKEAFADYPKAITNTAVIAERCNVELRLKGEEGFEKKLPAFPIPKEFVPPASLQGKFDILPSFQKPKTKYEVLAIAYLCDLAETRFKELFPPTDPAYEKAKQRLRYELGVIISKGFTNYFLIVQDFVRFAKDNGIAVGPGRGSAAGSFLCYCLGIIDISPIHYNLMFERFLNPERFDDPDIDIDFSQEFRYRLFEYAQQKYGMGSTAKIITFNNFGGRLGIRDVGRVLKIKASFIDQLAKSIEKSVDELDQNNAFVNALIRKEPKIKTLLTYVKMIEKLPRNRSMHAAGLILSEGHLSDHVPVMVSVDKETKKPILVTQIHKDALELLGLAKIDLLGLRNLDIIEETKQLIRQTKGLALNTIPLQDEKTFSLYQQGETIGVFQMDSKQMRATSAQVKPTKVEDIFPLIALYRPGSMDMIPIYAQNRAQNRFQVYDMHEQYDEKKKTMVKHFTPFERNVDLLKPILENTYGVIVYQEQITQILQTWAGYQVGEADLVRRAISKKNKEVLEDNQRTFVTRSLALGRDPETSKRLYELIVKFANYGFNVPHATAYGILSYETAYLKANFPVEFMSASITSHMDDVEKASVYVKEALRMGITVEKPNINESMVGFDVHGETLRFGLALIKHVGKKAAEAIVRERQAGGSYQSFEHFMDRVGTKSLQLQCIKALIGVGAFDAFDTRKQLLEKVEQKKKRHPLFRDQIVFQDIPGIKSDEMQLTKQAEEFSRIEKIQTENKLMGMYFTIPPITYFQEEIKQTVALLNKQKRTPNLFWVVGSITVKNIIKDRNKNKMAFINLFDGQKTWEITVFHQLWKEWADKIMPFQLYVLEVYEKNQLFSLKSIQELKGRTEVQIALTQESKQQLPSLAKIVSQYAGTDTLCLTTGDKKSFYPISWNPTCVQAFEEIGIKKETMKINNVRYV